MERKHIAVKGSLFKRKVPKLNADTYKAVEFVEVNGKPALIFDYVPALVFISHDGHGSYDQTFVNGEESLTHNKITITSECGAVTTVETKSYAVLTETTEE